MKVPRDVLDIDDRIVDQKAQGQDQGKERHAVDRKAKEQIDKEGQTKDHRNGDRHDEGLPPSHPDRQEQYHDQNRDPQGLDQLVDFFIGRLARVACDDQIDIIR